VLVTDSDHIILCAVQPETVAARLGQKGGGAGGDGGGEEAAEP
jgi:regulator of extracellular matrix RemA (YlzA/DUF370 family)